MGTTDNRKNAEMVSEMVNSFSFDYQGFCDEMSKEHRTLQQNFTRLCIYWLSHCASDGYQYDGRNEASHEVAKLIMSVDADSLYLPMV